MHQEGHPADVTRKPVLGLLGAPGSGKSTIARLFADLGCGVIDADRLAQDALNTHAVRKQLRAWWGAEVIDQNNQVDRSAVGHIVFSDESQLKRLESILHPAVHEGRRAHRDRYDADPSVPAIIEDTPLLLEFGLDKECDALVFIDCPLAVRLARVAETRGWSAEELARREEHQAPLDTKRQAADYVIHNEGDHEQIRQQVAQVLQQATRG